MMSQVRVAAVEGWFTLDEKPALLSSECKKCSALAFPPVSHYCRNPDCEGSEFAVHPLSRFGKVWSYTDAHYQPPPPYIATALEHIPFAIVAVELEEEGLVILGQAVAGVEADDLYVGQTMELVLEKLYLADGVEYMVWKWKPCEVNT